VATIIRALALGDVRTNDLPRVLVREALTGLGVGVLLGMIGMVLALLWGTGLRVGLTVAATLPAVCIWAEVVGSLIPITADRVGIDPALVSTPFISTLVDATGLFIYFTVAQAVLGL